MSHPIPAESVELLNTVVPPPNRPPLLYQEMAVNTAVLRGYIERPILGTRGLLYTGQMTSQDRELCILRVTGRKRAVHECGVHVAYFGRTSGLSESQVAATATNSQPTPDWTDRQRAVIAIADAVVNFRPLAGRSAELVKAEMDVTERAEFIALASQYLAISSMCRVLEVPVEPGTPEMPTVTTDHAGS